MALSGMLENAFTFIVIVIVVIIVINNMRNFPVCSIFSVLITLRWQFFFSLAPLTKKKLRSNT